jgi:PAS domain S-box-containing protein
MISILYIDDEPALLEVGKRFLERDAQVSVDTISSAPAALTLLNTKNYNAIISDYQMPDMDGIEFLKVVRKRYGSIPFILFTGRGREEVAIDAINNGADFYLQKGGESTAQFTELAHKINVAVERRQALDALVRTEKEFETLVECAPDAIYIADSQRFIYANPAFARMLGATSPDQLIGMSIYDRIHADYHSLIRERVHLVHDEEKPSGLKDVVYLKMDGTPVYVETSAAPLRFHGQPAGLVILRDISVRKQAQEELGLASRRAKEAAELAQKKLYMVSEITRHEIRNAITGIIGCVDLAYQLPAGTERDQLNRDIKDLSLRIQRQIEFTREYEEIGIREPQWYPVRQLIPSCEKPHMKISQGLELLEVYADPLIVKIFTYLVENAIRHGGKATEVRIREDGCVEGKFRIVFEDNGTGVPEEMKTKIFERKIGDRKGMGLCMVREILGITGITITETGTPGQGARFEILVPDGGFRFQKKN